MSGRDCQDCPWTRPRSASPASRSPPQGRSKGRPVLFPEDDCFRRLARIPAIGVHQRERLRLQLGGTWPEAISEVAGDPHVQKVVTREVLEGSSGGPTRDAKCPGDGRCVVPAIPFLDAQRQNFQIFERTKVVAAKREGHGQSVHGAIRMLTTAAGAAVSGPHLMTRLIGRHCIAGLEVAMLWTLFVLVLLVWVIGFLFDVAGGLIHLLLLVALGIFLVNILSADDEPFSWIVRS